MKQLCKVLNSLPVGVWTYSGSDLELLKVLAGHGLIVMMTPNIVKRVK